MFDISTYLKALNRPSLLVKTAKLALTNFNRDVILERIFGYELADKPEDVIQDLIEHEREMNTQRKTGDVTYNIARHVSVLTALMHEADAYIHGESAFT